MAKSKKKGIPYTPREVSWAYFNERVLQEAVSKSAPPLERLKFLSIVSSNFDEFFMVRVARLIRERESGNRARCPSGQRPGQILKKVTSHVHQLVAEQTRCMTKEVLPKLAKKGLKLVGPGKYTDTQKDYLQTIFSRDIFPALTPMAVKPDKPLLPLISNLKLHLAFLLKPVKGKSEARKLAILQVPPAMDRFLFLPCENEPTTDFALLEDVIRSSAASLFPGFRIVDSTVFRVTRDADMSVDEEHDENFMEAMAEVLVDREHSRPVRLEIAADSPDILAELTTRLDLPDRDVYQIDGPLDLKRFMSLCFLPGFDALRNKEWLPQQPIDIPADANLFELLRERDVLLHHPYESYDPVVRLIELAADDPKVLAVKMTLYRTSGDSPIIRALAQAARNGKQVTALVELKARFDEEQNLGWAELLEQAGVIVIYGLVNLKVHAKALLIVRQEAESIVRYFHMGTGNYNDKTAKLYTDMGLMSTREDVSYEIALFFNAITGYSLAPNLRKISMAPHGLRTRFNALIEREIERAQTGGSGLIIAKMNSLVDPGIIEMLYKASQAGVEVKLNIRGICCLQPGIKGVSENIRVVSVIDRYLEHSRIFYFENGGAEEVFMSSADWMTRNLNRRVELMFPVEEPHHIKRLRDALAVYFDDNESSHLLHADGTYTRIEGKKGQNPCRSQEVFHRLFSKSERREKAPHKEFVVRRKPPKGKI